MNPPLILLGVGTPLALLVVLLFVLAIDAAYRHRERLLTALDVLAGVTELLSYLVLGGLEEVWEWVMRRGRQRAKLNLVTPPEWLQRNEERRHRL